MKDNQAKYPQLRFKGFTDPWEERKLGEFSDVRDGTHASPKYVSQGHPMVTSKNLTHSGLDMTDVSFLTDEDFNEINKRSKVSIGDILFGMIGTIGNPVIVDRDDFAIKNVVLIKEKTSNPITNKWLLQYLKSPSFNRFIQKENAGGTQKFIALGLIREMKLRVPEFDEQQKIGSFFKQLDDTIALHQRKLDLLKEQKKGYLQKMFPKNGSKFPQLRFAGFADAWGQRKFKDILKTHSFRSYLADISENGEYEVIQQGDKPIVGYSDGKPFTNYKDITLFGDHTVSLYKPKRPFFVATDGVKILSADNFEGDYLYTTLERYKPEPQGYKRHFTILKNQDVWFTGNMEEQQKIGTFFKQLDDTITLHQRKLQKLQELKKGYLQKMFC